MNNHAGIREQDPESATTGGPSPEPADLLLRLFQLEQRGLHPEQEFIGRRYTVLTFRVNTQLLFLK